MPDVGKQRKLEPADSTLVTRRIGPCQVHKLAVNAAANKVAFPGGASTDQCKSAASEQHAHIADSWSATSLNAAISVGHTKVKSRG